MRVTKSKESGKAGLQNGGPLSLGAVEANDEAIHANSAGLGDKYHISYHSLDWSEGCGKLPH